MIIDFKYIYIVHTYCFFLLLKFYLIYWTLCHYFSAYKYAKKWKINYPL